VNDGASFPVVLDAEQLNFSRGAIDDIPTPQFFCNSTFVVLI